MGIEIDLMNRISYIIGRLTFSFQLIQEERGVYLIDEMFQWSSATTIFENFFTPPPFPPRAVASWDYVRGVCRSFFR